MADNKQEIQKSLTFYCKPKIDWATTFRKLYRSKKQQIWYHNDAIFSQRAPRNKILHNSVNLITKGDFSSKAI